MYGLTSDEGNKENLHRPIIIRRRKKTKTSNSEQLDQDTNKIQGWEGEKILGERVNKASSKTQQQEVFGKINSSLKIQLNQVWNRKKKHEKSIDYETQIYMLKKEIQYLESDQQKQTEDIHKIKSKFPTKSQMLQTKYNKFRNKVQLLMKGNKKGNRLKFITIKNSEKIDSFLLSSPDFYQEQQKDRRPATSNIVHSLNNHFRTPNYKQANIKLFDSKGFRAYNKIPQSFKKCFMNKRNKSARSNLCHPTTDADKKYRHMIRGSQIQLNEESLKMRYPQLY